MLKRLQSTGDQPWLLVLRIVAGGMLLLFGVMHLTGAAPMRPIVEAAGFPLPALNAVLAPVLQVAAGVLLLSGYLARVGAAIAIAVMLGALYTHLVVANADWPGENEPPIFFPFIPMVPGFVILVFGAGRWSVDRAATGQTPPAPTPAQT